MAFRGPFNQAQYDAWRATIPFSNEAIAAQLERDAAAIVIQRPFDQHHADTLRRRAVACRAGRVSQRDVRQVYDALIKTCAVCGKKALYRSGSMGLCSDHRRFTAPEVAERQRRLSAKAAHFAAERKAADYEALADRQNHSGAYSPAASRRRASRSPAVWRRWG